MYTSFKNAGVIILAFYHQLIILAFFLLIFHCSQPFHLYFSLPSCCWFVFYHTQISIFDKYILSNKLQATLDIKGNRFIFTLIWGRVTISDKLPTLAIEWRHYLLSHFQSSNSPSSKHLRVMSRKSRRWKNAMKIRCSSAEKISFGLAQAMIIWIWPLWIVRSSSMRKGGHVDCLFFLFTLFHDCSGTVNLVYLGKHLNLVLGTKWKVPSLLTNSISI